MTNPPIATAVPRRTIDDGSGTVLLMAKLSDLNPVAVVPEFEKTMDVKDAPSRPLKLT